MRINELICQIIDTINVIDLYLILSIMEKDRGEESLIKKYNSSKNFQQEMIEADRSYNALLQQGQYCDLSEYQDGMIDILVRQKDSKHDQVSKNLRINQESTSNANQIYLYYGGMQPNTNGKVDKLIIHFIKNFPKPDNPYILVYINNFQTPNAAAALADFKKMFLMLPLQYFKKLRKFIILKQTLFFQKDIFYWGTLSKYLKDKTVYIQNIEKICQYLCIQYEALVIILPDFVAYDLQIKDFDKIVGKNKGSNSNRRKNVQGINTTVSKLNQRERFDKLFQNQMLAKNGKQKQRCSYLQQKKIMSNSCQITDYELNQVGIPLLLHILIAYFKGSPEGLKIQGIFRKSVSIDEQNKLMIHIVSKDYDFLSYVSDPHLIANLIKRFLAGLKTPIFPYDVFYILMKDQSLDTIKTNLTLSKLKRVNYMTLLFLLQFLKDEVITRQKQNKMTIQAVSVCFAPCLMRAQFVSNLDLLYAGKSVSVMRSIIENFEYIFGDRKKQRQSYRQSYLIEKKKSFESSQLSFSRQQKLRNSGNYDQRPMQIPQSGNCSAIQQKEQRQYSDDIQSSDNEDYGCGHQQVIRNLGSQNKGKNQLILAIANSQKALESNESTLLNDKCAFKSSINQSTTSKTLLSSFLYTKPREEIKIEESEQLVIQGLEEVQDKNMQTVEVIEDIDEQPQIFITKQLELYMTGNSHQARDWSNQNRLSSDKRGSYYQDLSEGMYNEMIENQLTMTFVQREANNHQTQKEDEQIRKSRLQNPQGLKSRYAIYPKQL